MRRWLRHRNLRCREDVIALGGSAFVEGKIGGPGLQDMLSIANEGDVRLPNPVRLDGERTGDLFAVVEQPNGGVGVGSASDR